jgi:hypothetical protein
MVGAKCAAMSKEHHTMHGHIIKFDHHLGYGVIAAEDGNRFRFAKSEIKNPNGKLVGYDVDFLVESRRPKEIFLMHGTPWDAFGSAQS